MCLAVPGELLEITDTNPITRRGKVSFGGIVKEINLAFVPEATVGDYVLVHIGFALSKIDEKEAKSIFSFIEDIGHLEELVEER
ncbi:MAG: HypC/HybG/HupF family hydrogenase formation chaperone [Deltaproteobacteria bacterium]|nr:HypC/HybG/HupF family hydrogenase formation chaperone [Deltaproteobacteria bacterium]